MSLRPLALAGVLGAAVGGPYVLSQGPDSLGNPWGPSAQPGAEAAAEQAAPAEFDLTPPVAPPPEGPGGKIYGRHASLTGPAGISLADALNWNITKNWVYTHWDRKSTGLSDPQLFGVRVPIVTGAGMTDVAGAVSYYFDNAGTLQKIRLKGRTADTSRLVYLATTAFGMAPRTSAAPGEQLYQAFDGDRLKGELRTRPEGVLWGASPHESFDVAFEATRPGSPYSASSLIPRFQPPGAAGADAATAPGPGQPDAVFPARTVVPDAAPSAEPANEPATEAAADGAAKASGPPTPKLPEFGAPAEAPPRDVKPLDGYRDRFRWPG
ncbi:DUF6690 family protein [Botrimarina sp.]|uniref:DUF6690 family protein n=1 Tax=Botrimarina sp. TaxID=2795802 RepID=UPI0032ED47B2